MTSLVRDLLIPDAWLLFSAGIVIPLALALLHRSRTGSWPTMLRTASTAFLIIGSWMLLRSSWILVELGGVPKFLDVHVKAGAGLVITAGVCAAADYFRRAMPPARALQPRGDNEAER